jgi:hypothetical protein
MTGFPQTQQTSSGGSSSTLSVLSANVRYTDPTSTTVATGAAAARTIGFFRYVPKTLGEITISVDASSSSGTAIIRVFSASTQNASNVVGSQGGGTPAVNSFTLGASIAVDGTNVTSTQGTTAALATISSTSLTTYTFNYNIFSMAPIFIGTTSTVSSNITMANLRVSYDLINL